MTSSPRYAIYYAPHADTALGRFGARMLGTDAFSGEDIAFAKDLAAQMPDWRDITSDPRRYGFHATLKAPFVLAAGTDEAQLRAACARFAGVSRVIPSIMPVVRTIEGFTAIVPDTPSAALTALAQDCVVAFDQFRAPMSAADRARRWPERLSARQVAQLDRWGYPYVMDDFRFHMTLTGRLPPERRDAMVTLLQAQFAALGLHTLAIDRIVLFRQETRASRFRVVETFPLRGA